MSEEYEFVITADGLKRRRIIEENINITSAIVDQIAASVSRSSYRVMPMKIIDPENPWTASLMALPGKQTVWSLPLTKLTIKTFFQSKDGTVFPVFDDTTSPQLALEWQVPSGMYLVLAVVLDASRNCVNQYLVAFDSAGRTWRLPLSNLYGDCRLCSGKYTVRPKDQIEALTAAMTQFYNGEWNKDLYEGDAEKRKRTRGMFSFKVEEKGFSQIAPAGDWMALCDKVANEFITANIINPATI